MKQMTADVRSYAGRTVDYLAFDGMIPSPESQLSQTLAQPGQSGAMITGIEKLVQRFLIELLTEQGSLHYQPSRGTFFMTALRAGTIRTSQDLFSSFSSAEVDIRDNLKMEETLSADPEDERYAGSELLSASLLGDTASLLFSISSVAGETRIVTYPLRIAAI